MNREICPIGYHLVSHSLFTDDDSEQFLSFIVLKHFYPNLTYWSWNGYSVSAFADYSKDLVWRDNQLVKWSTKEIINEMPDFHKSNRPALTQAWVKACGDKPEELMKTYMKDAKHYV